MDPAYATAFAALGGAMVGGLTSFATSWTSLHTQMRAQRTASSKSRRQKLYKKFIDATARVYGDALMHNKLETGGFIDLHALVSEMRIVSSRRVIESAIDVVRVIAETYTQPNKSDEELEIMIIKSSVDILLGFSQACREEFELRLEL